MSEDCHDWYTPEQRAAINRDVEEFRKRLRGYKHMQGLQRRGELIALHGAGPGDIQTWVSRDTLQAEDCIFLWSCGIRVDEDLTYPRRAN